MNVHLWPWSKKVIERGNEAWNRYSLLYEVRTFEYEFNRDFVVYEVTNHWTGSVTIEKEYLN